MCIPTLVYRINLTWSQPHEIALTSHMEYMVSIKAPSTVIILINWCWEPSCLVSETVTPQG